MIYFKSYFKFTKSQQSATFILLILIISLQCFYFFVDFSSQDTKIDLKELNAFHSEIDSLRKVAIKENKPRIFPFNPNFITDYKGYTLGMSLEEIDRLHVYRAKDLWVNSSKEFKSVTKMSDSLLETIAPYFKFPEWITNPKPKALKNNYKDYNKALTYEQKTDLNTATANALQRVNGIGEKLSARIVKFRNKFVGGFIADIQLQDVYGLRPEVIERITNQFTVKTPRQIVKHHINSATVDDLVTMQHIDYDLAYEIVDQRILRDGFTSFDELTKVKGFPIHKIEIIKLYLTLD